MRYLLFLVFLSFLSSAMPPILKQLNTSECWNTAALQLVRNIKPVTEALIKDKQQKLGIYYGKGNDLADAYIDFLEATFGNDQNAIDAAQKKLYSLTCSAKGKKEGLPGNPQSTINTLYDTFPTLFDRHAIVFHTPFYKGKLRKQLKMYLSGIFKNSFQNTIDTMEKYKKDELKILPEYLILQGEYDEKSAKYLCAWNTYPFEKYYELIGIIDSAFEQGGSFWTYLKDEFDDKHPWYKRYSADTSSVKALLSEPTFNCPAYILYKKIPGSVEKYNTFDDPLDELGNAFLDITEGK